MPAEIAVALAAAAALDTGGVRYLLGGSLHDGRGHVAELDVDPAAARSAVRAGSCFNLIHEASGIKVDPFIARSRFDRLQMDRRGRIAVGGDSALYVYTPEDIRYRS